MNKDYQSRRRDVENVGLENAGSEFEGPINIIIVIIIDDVNYADSLPFETLEWISTSLSRLLSLQQAEQDCRDHNTTEQFISFRMSIFETKQS